MNFEIEILDWGSSLGGKKQGYQRDTDKNALDRSAPLASA